MAKLATETKSDDGALLSAFEAFKDANDARLEAIEKRGQSDPLIEDRLNRIDRTIDRLTQKAARPALGEDTSSELTEHKSAWAEYMRKGETHGIAHLDTKALTEGTPSQGGYVAPPELDRLIEARLLQASPMRQIAGIRQTSAMNYQKPVSLGSSASWVGETDPRPETTAPTLDLLQFPAAELYAMPAATQALLDDAYVDIDEWLAEEVETAFSAQESDAFVNGDGVNKPMGFLGYTLVDDASHTWGDIGYIPTGTAGDFDATDPVDALIDLIYAPKSHFRNNGRFVMNRRTLSEVRKLKDSSGQYIWQPGQAGEASTVLGYPVTEIEDMPDMAAGSFSIAFGDFNRGYLIVDRQGARVLRDPYSNKPYVLFYTTKRVGGGVQNFDAIKVLKFDVS